MIQQKAELVFPIDWEFRIIISVAAEPDVLPAIGRVFGDKAVNMARGSVSRNGAYVTIKAKLRLLCREELEHYSQELAHIPGVKYLL